MSNRFFIFGLPRSRTAWMANLLTWQNSFCFHECWVNCNDPSDLEAELEQFPADFMVGNCDSMNVLYADWIFTRYPDAKFVYLYRPENHVANSLDRIDPVLSSALPMLRGLAQRAMMDVHSRGGLVFDVEKWTPHDTFLLWQYLLPHIPYPKQRNDQLEWMRVTITEDRWDYLKLRAQQLLA